MTNELGTTLLDIENDIKRRTYILGRLKTAVDLLRMYDHNGVNWVVISAINDATEYIINKDGIKTRGDS